MEGKHGGMHFARASQGGEKLGNAFTAYIYYSRNLAIFILFYFLTAHPMEVEDEPAHAKGFSLCSRGQLLYGRGKWPVENSKSNVLFY